MSSQTEIQKYRAMLENLSEQPENLTALEEIAESIFEILPNTEKLFNRLVDTNH